jgi:hypothetical protein
MVAMEESDYEAYPVYEEPHPTTWDYGLPLEQGPAGPPPGGWGYYDEPQRLAHDRADAFWDTFAGPSAADPPPGPGTVPPSSAPYPPRAAPPAGRKPASHRHVVARPAVRGRSRIQGSLVAAIALLVLACGGGAYAIVASLTGQAGNRNGTGAPGQPTSAVARSSPLPPSASPAAASAVGSATVSPAASTQAAPAAATPSGAGPAATAPAGTTAGTTAVAVSPAARADSAEPAVAAWLGRYFSAINTHDYQAYSSLLGAQEAADQSQSEFTSGYGTTTDSAATLASISDLGGGGEAATVSFTSHQSPARSVNDSSCDSWTITIYLEPNGSGYAEVPPPAGYHPSYESC